MNGQTIYRVNRILKDQLCLPEDPVATDEILHALGADSLDIVEIVMAIEEEFDIDIPDEDCFKPKKCTVGAVYEYVESKVK